MPGLGATTPDLLEWRTYLYSADKVDDRHKYNQFNLYSPNFHTFFPFFPLFLFVTIQVLLRLLGQGLHRRKKFLQEKL